MERLSASYLIRYYGDVSVFGNDALYGVSTNSYSILEDGGQSLRLRKLGSRCTIADFCTLSGEYGSFCGFSEGNYKGFGEAYTYYQDYYLEDYYQDYLEDQDYYF